MRQLDSNGQTILVFNEDKAGPPVVFIHGITSSVWFWTLGQTPLVAERCRWLSMSLPGHAPSVFPPGMRRDDLTAEWIAETHAAALESVIGTEPAILIGHSTGGFSVLNLAARYPERVRSVVSVSGFAHGRWIGLLGFYQWLVRRGSVGRALYKAAYKIVLSNYALFRPAVSMYAADRKALYANPLLEPALRAQFPTAQQLDLDAMITYFYRMPDIDITPLLSQITAPVLALAGSRDPIVPPAQARLIAERVPNGHLKLLDGAGHIPMLERADAYQAAITDWILQTQPELA